MLVDSPAGETVDPVLSATSSKQTSVMKPLQLEEASKAVSLKIHGAG